MALANLAVEIVIDILARLPVQDLLKCMCVCKTWCTVITQQIFISAHLNHHKNTEANGYILRQKTGLFPNNFSLLHRKSYVEVLHSQVPFSCESKYFKLAASLNGVICLTDSSDSFGQTIYLWNPSVSRLKILARSCFARHLNKPGTFMVLGFAFHRHDFKIVRVMCNVVKEQSKAEVYSLTANTWRNVGETSFMYFSNEKSISAYVNGAVHWLASNSGNDSGNIIVSFDFDTGKFEEIKLPNYHNGQFAQTQVSVLRESLVLIVCYLNDLEQIENCCLWVMREYGVAKSWSKDYWIVPQGGICYCLDIINNRDLMMELASGELVSYDLETQCFKHLGIGGLGDDFTLDLVAYDESLVLCNKGFRLRSLLGEWGIRLGKRKRRVFLEQQKRWL